MDRAEIKRVHETLQMFDKELQGMSVLDESVEGDEDLGQPKGIDQALDDDDCGPAEGYDVVDHAIDDVINLLAQEYEDDSATDAVFDALEVLVAEEKIEDTPDMDEPEEKKAAWVANSIPKLKEQLKAMGLEF